VPKHESETRFPAKPGRTIHDITQSVRMKRNIGGQNRQPANQTKIPRKGM